MEKLVLPDSLLYIGDRAFRGNESLHTVILGGRTKSIGAYAFASCTNLEKIEIPSSVQHIGSYAFLYTAFGNHLVNDYTGFVTLGDGVLVAYNGKEKDIVVPEGITSITGAFFNTPVESVTLPSTLRIVGDYAFCQATALKNVYFSKFSSPDEIGDHAFEGCKALQTIALPDSVTKIGNDAFANCTSLERIVLPNGVQSIGSSAFFDCDKLTDLHFPAGLKSIGSRAFNGCASLTGIQLPDSVYSIGNYAFYNCKQLTTVRFPAGLTEISSGLFSSCSQLQAVTLPDTVQKIGANAFWGCTELEQITLSRHLQDIGLDAFYKTKYLNELHKRDGAFAECNHVLIGYDGETSEVVVPDGIERIAAPFARDPFDNPTETPITSLVFPDSVTEIDKYALRNCSELRELTFGDGVRTISGELLIHCSKLEKVTFGRGLTCIERQTSLRWAKNALLYVPAGSYALDWAREHGFTYRVID